MSANHYTFVSGIGACYLAKKTNGVIISKDRREIKKEEIFFLVENLLTHIDGIEFINRETGEFFSIKKTKKHDEENFG